MKRILLNAKRILTDQRGQGLVEYGMILVLAVAAIVAAFGGVGDAIKGAGQAVGDFITEKVNEIRGTTP